MAKGFAVVGGLFAASECVVEKVHSLSAMNCVLTLPSASWPIRSVEFCNSRLFLRRGARSER